MILSKLITAKVSVVTGIFLGLGICYLNKKIIVLVVTFLIRNFIYANMTIKNTGKKFVIIVSEK